MTKLLLPEMLASLGYARRRNVIGPSLCGALRSQALAALCAKNWHPGYQIGRWIGSSRIRSPWQRHAVPLAHSPEVQQALAVIAAVLLEAGLPPTAKLVELSAAITLPGALGQVMHPDIAPATPNVSFAGKEVAPLVTAWLSLQSIQDLSGGPTVVYPSSHRRFAARSARILRQKKEDAAKEEYIMRGIEHDYDFRMNRRAEIVAARNALAYGEAALDNEREEREFGPLTSLPLLLDVREVALMDCRVLHFGSAYPRQSWLTFSDTQQAERILLNATFASAGSNAAPFEGFTYHRHSEVPDVSLEEALRASSMHFV
eukprot:TRINITY_DN9700_c0_g1_i5.p1 TRINITY_DN9700_c0_g1~~TRINITY_DN9700_c0_g1_i5.p1  ORF type:complete len:316 (+),score=50.35 TRINITY_DN9700_c0_g1_i5:162-1109(+)